MPAVRLTEIIDFLAGEVVSVKGNADRVIERVAPFNGDELSTGTLTYCVRPEMLRSAGIRAVVLCPHGPDTGSDTGAVYVSCRNPRLAMIRVIRKFFGAGVPSVPIGVDAHAYVHPEAEIDPSAAIGPFANIGKCSVGAESIIHGGAILYDGVLVGARVIIDSGAVIGGEGFGYERTESGALERFPHLGSVELNDDVEVGANATIDRGTFGNTLIGRGAKIDNLAYIAHNVVVGADSMIMARAVLCGSVTIGERCWIAPSSTVRDGITVGNDVTVGLGSVVIENVAAGLTVFGVPARPRK